MDSETLTNKLHGLIIELERLKHGLTALATVDIDRYPDNYKTLSTDLAIRMEDIACKFRHIIYSTGFVKKAVLMCNAAEAHGIHIETEADLIQVTMPSVMPKRKYRNNEFLTEPLHYALNEYTARNPLRKFKECVVCFSHIHSWELGRRYVRDFDNFELKRILDIIAVYVMEDDSGLLCDAYSTSEFGEKDCTVITIMTNESFPAWLKEHNSRIKNISDFY